VPDPALDTAAGHQLGEPRVERGQRLLGAQRREQRVQRENAAGDHEAGDPGRQQRPVAHRAEHLADGQLDEGHHRGRVRMRGRVRLDGAPDHGVRKVTGDQRREHFEGVHARPRANREDAPAGQPDRADGRGAGPVLQVQLGDPPQCRQHTLRRGGGQRMMPSREPHGGR
jgi:hypothetical protein